MSAADALNVLKTKLHESLDQVNLDLYDGSNTPVNFNFGLCVDNLAGLLWPFYLANNRMPAVLFNDGVPPSAAASLKSQQPIMVPFVLNLNTFNEPFTAVNIGDINTFLTSTTIPNVKVKLNGKTWHNYQGMQSGDPFYVDVNIPAGWINTRHFDLVNIAPLEIIDVGAYQTWAILLLIYSRPDLCFVSDDGILLYPKGIEVLENSMKYFMFRRTNGVIGGNVLNIYDVAGSGPFLVGFPLKIIEVFNEQFQKQLAAESGFTPFLIEMAHIVLSAVGLYFGASALSGIVAGNFAIANLTSSLNLAKSFGINTGQLGTGLQLFNLTTGAIASSVPVTTGAKNVDLFGPIDFSAPIDPSYFDALGASSTLDFTGVDAALANITIDPTFDTASFSSAVDAFNQSASFDQLGVGLPTDLNVAAGLGPVSTVQYAASVGASSSVASAASDAMNAVGGGDSTLTASSDQVATAAKTAANNSLTLSAAGDIGGSTIWATASKLLSMYLQYQQVANKTPLPNRVTYPNAVGQPVRQPDGSISILNKDGTISTVRPNGSVINSFANSDLPSFLSGNTPLYIGLGLLGVLLLMSRRR